MLISTFALALSLASPVFVASADATNGVESGVVLLKIDRNLIREQRFLVGYRAFGFFPDGTALLRSAKGEWAELNVLDLDERAPRPALLKPASDLVWVRRDGRLSWLSPDWKMSLAGMEAEPEIISIPDPGMPPTGVLMDPFQDRLAITLNSKTIIVGARTGQVRAARDYRIVAWMARDRALVRKFDNSQDAIIDPDKIESSAAVKWRPPYLPIVAADDGLTLGMNPDGPVFQLSVLNRDLKPGASLMISTLRGRGDLYVRRIEPVIAPL